ARPRIAPAAIGTADARGQPADLLDRGKIEAAAPDEGAQRAEERLARLAVAGRGARADERSALPRQRRALVVAHRRVERQRERADLRGRAQPQVDAEHVALTRLPSQHLDHRLGIALSGLAGLVALAPRQSLGREQQHEVDVRAVVELARAVLAE